MSHKVVESVLREILNRPVYTAPLCAGVTSPSSDQDGPTLAHREMSSPVLERVSISQIQPVPLLNNRAQISMTSSVRSSATETRQGTKSDDSVFFSATTSTQRGLKMEQPLTKQQESEVPVHSLHADVETSSLNCVHNDVENVCICKSAEKVMSDSLPGNEEDDGHLDELNSASCLGTSPIKQEPVSCEACQTQPQMSTSEDGENRQEKKYKKRIFVGDSNTRRVEGGCNVCRKETALLEEGDRTGRRNLPILRVCLKRLDPTKFNLKTPFVQKRKVGRPKGSKNRPTSGSPLFPCPEAFGLSKSPEDATRVVLPKNALQEYLKKRPVGLSAEECTVPQDNSVTSSKAVDIVNRKADGLSENRECSCPVDQNFNIESNRKDISQEDSGSELTLGTSMDSVSRSMQEALSNQNLLDNVANSSKFSRKCKDNTSQQLTVTGFSEDKNGKWVNAEEEHNSGRAKDGGSDNRPASQECTSGKSKSECKTGSVNSNKVMDTANTGTEYVEKTSEEERGLESHLLDVLDKRKRTHGAEGKQRQKDEQQKSQMDISLLAKSVENGGCGHLPKSILECSDDKEMGMKFGKTRLQYEVVSGQRKGRKRLQTSLKETLVEDKTVGKKLKCGSSNSLAEVSGIGKKGKPCSEINVLSMTATKWLNKKQMTEVMKSKSPSGVARRAKRPYKKRITEVMKLKLSSDEGRSLNRMRSVMKVVENRKRETVAVDVLRKERPVAKKIKYVESSDSSTVEGRKRPVQEIMHNKLMNENSFSTQVKNGEQKLVVGENEVKKKRGRPPKNKLQEEELRAKTRKGSCDEQCRSVDNVLGKVFVSSKKGASSKDELRGKLKDRKCCKKRVKKESLDGSEASEVKKRGPYGKKREKVPLQSSHRDCGQGRGVKLCKKKLRNLPSTISGQCVTKQSAPQGKKLLSGYLSQTAVKRYSHNKQSKMNSYCHQGAQLRKLRSGTKVQTELQKQNEGKRKTESSVTQDNSPTSSAAAFISVRTSVKQSESLESVGVRLANQRRSVMNQTVVKPKPKKTMTAKWKRYLDKLKQAAVQRRSAIASAAVNEHGGKRGPLKKQEQAETMGSDETKVKGQGLSKNMKNLKSETVSMKKPYTSKSSATYKTKVSFVKAMNGNVNKKKAKTQKELLSETRLRMMKEGREKKAARREKKRLHMLHLLKLRQASAGKGRQEVPETSIKSKSGEKEEFSVLKTSRREEQRGKRVVTKTESQEKLKKHRAENPSTHLKFGKSKVLSSPPVIEIERDPSFDDGAFSCPYTPAPKDGARKQKLFVFTNPFPTSSLMSQPKTLNTCDLSHSCCQKSRVAKVDVSTQWEDPLPLYSALMYREMFSIARRDSEARLEPGEEWTVDEESLLESLINLARRESSYLNQGESPSRADQQSPSVPPSLSCDSWKNSPPLLSPSSGAVLSACSSSQTPISQRRASFMRMESRHSVHVQMNDSYSSYTVVKTQPHRPKCEQTSSTSDDELWNEEWEYTPETNVAQNQIVETNAEEKQQESCSEDMSCPVICSVASVSEEDFSQANLTDADNVCGRESRNPLGISPCHDLTQPCDSSSGDNHGDNDNPQNFSKGQALKCRCYDSQEKPHLQGRGLRLDRSERCKNPLSANKQNERNVETHYTACNDCSVNESADQNSLDTTARSMSTSSFVVVSEDSGDDQDTCHANCRVPSQCVQNTPGTEKLKTSILCEEPERNCSGKQTGRNANKGRDHTKTTEDPPTSAFPSSSDHPGCENWLPQGFPSQDSSEHCDDPFKNVMIFVHNDGLVSDYVNKEFA